MNYKYQIGNSVDCILFKGVRPSQHQNTCHGSITKLYLIMGFEFFRSGDYGVPLYCRYSRETLTRIGRSCDLSMNQKDLFENHLYSISILDMI